MRILVASKFYYDRGGAEIVARRSVDAFQAAGHEVGVLAMDYPLNRDLPEQSFLAPKVGFDAPFAMALRTLGLGSVRRTIRKALEEFRPDVVHLHNVHSYLSPLVGEMAHKRGITVVWSLHDYKLLCGAYTFPRGESCLACNRNPLGILKNRCLHNNLVISAMGVLEARMWNRKRITDFTDIFVSPSSYMASVMAKGGFPKERIRIVRNSVRYDFLYSGSATEVGDFFLYVGRLSPEKGVKTLIRAAKEAGVKLKIAGCGTLLEEMKRANMDCPDIEFTGLLEAPEVAQLMRRAKAVVVPSECPENNPLVVMEALCSGAPVVGSAVGGIPELLDGDNSIMFEPGNIGHLTDILREADFGRFDRGRISAVACERFSPDSFDCKMVKVIEEVVG